MHAAIELFNVLRISKVFIFFMCFSCCSQINISLNIVSHSEIVCIHRLLGHEYSITKIELSPTGYNWRSQFDMLPLHTREQFNNR
jgi:hypothetical protein